MPDYVSIVVNRPTRPTWAFWSVCLLNKNLEVEIPTVYFVCFENVGRLVGISTSAWSVGRSPTDRLLVDGRLRVGVLTTLDSLTSKAAVKIAESTLCITTYRFLVRQASLAGANNGRTIKFCEQ